MSPLKNTKNSSSLNTKFLSNPNCESPLPFIAPLNVRTTNKSANMSENAAGSSATGSTSSQATALNDLIKAVDHIVNDLAPKFEKVSAEIYAKLDEMGTRIDEIEAMFKAGQDTGSEEV